ncbi:alkaline phosphatase family protein [Polaribacter batillariae]|uniref:Alkaline phosphatase family protein n=1 Tax=Polaribacter batillariae TaxID=2808900 RepID=A0ABX7SUK6_9FLAO|nr:alkaline phosphatase family protein [Polaribacter batillariae]QTD37856.1 alkaline phosphatase family protein [Polaribacter batillariae]
MKNILLLAVLFITTITFSQKKKVLLVGIDGLQFEELAKVKTPNFDKFNIKKGFNGGLFGTDSQQVTLSGPSWVTILTGVWTDHHKITSNSQNQVSASKSVFNYLKTSNSKLKTASISTWKNINLLLYKDMYLVDFATQGGLDDNSTKIAVDLIEKKGLDFVFVHLDDVDHAGHGYGFGEKYSNAILKMDENIGQLLKATEYRNQNFNEDWFIILVTDHGRDSKGFGHGNQTISEKTIFVGLNRKGNSFFENVNNNTKINTIQELEKQTIPQTAVVPTILKFLEIPIKKEWKLDSQPLIN